MNSPTDIINLHATSTASPSRSAVVGEAAARLAELAFGGAAPQDRLSNFELATALMWTFDASSYHQQEVILATLNRAGGTLEGIAEVLGRRRAEPEAVHG